MRLSDLSAAERQDYERLPGPLRELLDAELAAGNEIAEVQHWHPAAPVGASFLLRDAVTTRARESAGELHFYDRNGSQYSGEFTVSPRHFFVLEPPRPEPPPPDMDAIRAAMRGPEFRAEPVVPESDLVRRFRASMEMDYEKWREGTGYELDLLAKMNSQERETVETELLHRLQREGDWRDIEALAALDTPKAREAVGAARRHTDYRVRSWALQRELEAAAPGTEKEFEEEIVRLIEGAKGGLTEAIDLAVRCPTKLVRRAVLDQARTGDSTTRVNMAGLLFCLMGKTEEIFDWAHRPFFLRFGDHNEESDFRAAWRELRDMLAEFERS